MNNDYRIAHRNQRVIIRSGHGRGQVREVWLSGSPDEAADLLKPFPAKGMRIVRQGTEAKADPQEEAI